MGRKRHHPHVKASRHVFQEWEQGKPRYRHKDIPPGLWDNRQLDKWRRQVADIPNQPKVPHFKRPTLKHTEPFGPEIVLDALLRTDPRGAFTAGQLAASMNRQYPFWWATDIGTGKILAMLYSESEDHPRPEGVFPPLDMVASGGSSRYVLNPDPNAWGWLGHMREWWGDKAEEWMRHFYRTDGREWPSEDPWDALTDWLNQDQYPCPWGSKPAPPEGEWRPRRD